VMTEMNGKLVAMTQCAVPGTGPPKPTSAEFFEKLEAERRAQAAAQSGGGDRGN